MGGTHLFSQKVCHTVTCEVPESPPKGGHGRLPTGSDCCSGDGVGRQVQVLWGQDGSRPHPRPGEAGNGVHIRRGGHNEVRIDRLAKDRCHP